VICTSSFDYPYILKQHTYQPPTCSLHQISRILEYIFLRLLRNPWLLDDITRAVMLKSIDCKSFMSRTPSPKVQVGKGCRNVVFESPLHCHPCTPGSHQEKEKNSRRPKFITDMAIRSAPLPLRRFSGSFHSFPRVQADAFKIC